MHTRSVLLLALPLLVGLPACKKADPADVDTGPTGGDRDTDDPDDLATVMARLRRLSHRIVWVNPRAAADEFQPLVGGMAAALPHCSAMLSGHSLRAMREVILELGRTGQHPD